MCFVKLKKPRPRFSQKLLDQYFDKGKDYKLKLDFVGWLRAILAVKVVKSVFCRKLFQ